MTSVLVVVAVLIAAALVALLAIKTVQIIPAARAANVERFGRYRRTLKSGLNFVVPVLDRVKPLIDLREQKVSFGKRPVITQDNLVVQIDTVLFFQVTDPHAAAYEVVDYATALKQLSATVLRSIIGRMDLEQTLTSRDQINAMLRGVLDEASGKWGIRVTRVQCRAQQEKRTAILVAAGEKKRPAILKSDGQAAAARPAGDGGSLAKAA